MNKCFLTLWVLTLFSLTSYAQPDSGITYKRRFIECYAAVGGQFVNFSGLNGQLQKSGIDKVISAMAGVTLGAAYNVRRLTIGLDASLMQGYQHDVEASGINARIYAGFNILQSGSWAIAPEAGISFQTITLNITKPGTAGTFNEALTSAQNQVELQHNNTMLDVAMAFKSRTLHPSERRRLSIDLTARLGYRYGLGDNTWDIRRSSVSDGPKDRASNFYLSLAFVFGKNPGFSPGR